VAAEDIDIVGEIEKALDRQPFLPFAIVATSGDRYEVSGRHQVAVGRQVVIILPPDSTSVYLRTNQLVAVELAAPAA
jgi:hypothetical protein